LRNSAESTLLKLSLHRFKADGSYLVGRGEKLLTLEPMKMQTTIYASGDGTVDGIFAPVGDSVESKDLLLKLRK
jgi:biotin carboxyl carrier protein